MSNPTDNQAQTVLSLGVATEQMKQLKTCFYQEKDEVQEAIKKIAKKSERDFLLEYANYLFVSNLEKQYKVERTKYVASMKSTIDLMVKSGVKREAILGAVGVDESELTEMVKAPSKGAAKKLADIGRLLA